MSFSPTLAKLLGVASASFVGGAIAGGEAWNRRKGQQREEDSAKVVATPNHSLILRHGVPSPLGPQGPICYSNHCLQFDPQRRTPVWVAEHLHREKAFPEKVRYEKCSTGIHIC